MSTAVSIVRDEANRKEAGQGRPEAEGPEPEGILPERDEDEAPLTGLRSLAFVAQARNIDLSFERLRHDHAPDGTEHDMRSLIRVARESGMKARGMRLAWEDLTALGPALPAIVRLKNGSFLVLLGAFEGPTARVLLVDPVAPDAPFELDEPRFSDSWDGDTLLLRPELNEEEGQRSFGFSWFFPEIGKQWKLFAEIGIAAIVLTLLALVLPFFTQLVIDRVLVHRSIGTLWVLMFGCVLAIAFEATFSFLRRYLVLYASNRIDASINIQVFSRLLNLPMHFFEHVATGIIVKNMAQAEKIRNFLTGQLFTTGIDLIGVVILIPILFAYSSVLALIVLLFSALISLIVISFLPEIRRQIQKLYEAEAAQQSYLVESIQGMRTIKSLSLDARQRQGWDVRLARSISLRFEVGKLIALMQIGIMPAERLLMATIMAVGAWLFFHDQIGMGALIAFNMISMRVIQPLIQASQLMQQFQEASMSVKMLGSIMNHAVEPGREGRGMRAPVKGKLDFVDVRFRYPGTTTPALDGVSFSAPEGTILGIMGRSGSGKTTITRLLQGLHTPQEGLIRVDGVDIREFDIDHLRANIGVVLQENFLFRGSIRENIAAGRPSAPLHEVMEAAQLAGAHEFVERLPRGYETLLEEGSSNLSGGQRQRLAIARALLVDPPILVLDEATSALDAESEAIVQANLMSIARGRTLVIVSHRLSALVPSDQILVMERGQVVDAGRHAELIGRCQIYRHLWQQQNRHTGGV